MKLPETRSLPVWTVRVAVKPCLPERFVASTLLLKHTSQHLLEINALFRELPKLLGKIALFDNKCSETHVNQRQHLHGGGEAVTMLRELAAITLLILNQSMWARGNIPFSMLQQETNTRLWHKFQRKWQFSIHLVPYQKTTDDTTLHKKHWIHYSQQG